MFPQLSWFLSCFSSCLQVCVYCDELWELGHSVLGWGAFGFGNRPRQRCRGWCLSGRVGAQGLSRHYSVRSCCSEALSRSCGWLRSETICCLHTCYISKGLWPSPTVLFFGGYYVPAGPSQRRPARNSTQPWPPSLGNCEALGFLCPARCSDLLISIWGSPTLPLLWVTSVSCRLSSPPHGQGLKTPHTSCPCALRTSTTQCQRSWCPSGSPTTWTQ